jgi:hypothetical protein
VEIRGTIREIRRMITGDQQLISMPIAVLLISCPPVMTS